MKISSRKPRTPVSTTRGTAAKPDSSAYQVQSAAGNAAAQGAGPAAVEGVAPGEGASEDVLTAAQAQATSGTGVRSSALPDPGGSSGGGAFSDRLAELRGVVRSAAEIIGVDAGEGGDQEVDDQSQDEATGWQRALDESGPAFGRAIDLWSFQARISQSFIHGPSLLIPQGGLDGPDLMSLGLAADIAGRSGAPTDVAQRIAQGLSDAFKRWQDQFTWPGVAGYPAFAAWPGPMTPPMPSIPVPLIVGGVGAISGAGGQLQAAIGEVPGAVAGVWETFKAQVVMKMLLWTSTTNVTFTGQGPVPTFAPPYVPVGPVVAGEVNPGMPIMFHRQASSMFGMSLPGAVDTWGEMVDQSSDALAGAAEVAEQAWEGAAQTAAGVASAAPAAAEEDPEATQVADEVGDTAEDSAAAAPSSARGAIDRVALAMERMFVARPSATAARKSGGRR